MLERKGIDMMKKTVSLLLAGMLLMTLFVSCGKEVKDGVQTSGSSASVRNENGEITGSVVTGGAYDAACEAEVMAGYPLTTTIAATYTGTYVYAGSPSKSDGIIDGGLYNPQIDYHAGMLTASEWQDNTRWVEWRQLLNENDWWKTATAWNVLTRDRVTVTVKNGETPVKNAEVTLCTGNDSVLYRAVTNNQGIAYLFFNLNGESGDKPAYVRVNADGKTAKADMSGDADAVEVQLAADNTAVKLDLLFMVDTTGSMGDELEFLKEEMADVVDRVAMSAQVPLRTSVNFYRDDGDEYIVRYFRFEDDVNASVAHIREQYANGGGDTPEAVHMALDNAVNGHAWDKDAVKLVILVLDAPPHDTLDVKASLTATMAKAAEMGIRIIPVVSSGSDDLTELLCRSYAVMTGGTYIYLTDDSGYGNAHSEQHINDDPEVEFLNDLLVRVITGYCS